MVINHLLTGMVLQVGITWNKQNKHGASGFAISSLETTLTIEPQKKLLLSIIVVG